MRHPPDPANNREVIFRLHTHDLVHVVNVLHILVLIRIITDNHIDMFDFSNRCYIQYYYRIYISHI
jgi:hypothetical protein